MALLLPCKPVLEATESGETHVAIADPQALLATGPEPNLELEAVAADAAAGLSAVIAGLGA